MAYNDLEGEIPRGAQFDTFSVDSFEGNPNLCGYILNRRCRVVEIAGEAEAEEEDDGISWYNLPFGLGYFGLVSVVIALLLNTF